MRVPSTLGAIAVSLGCLFLVGCAELEANFKRRFADRYGPDPVIQASDVTETVQRQTAIIATFYEAAQRSSWFNAAEVGMNYVDEKCDAYMRDLFIINREHGRVDGILKILDKTSGAVLAATPASKLALAAVAQSFGLAEGINDSVLKSYLFEQVPGIVADKVKAARVAYRKQIEEGSRPNYTPEEAFKVVRNYLELCMPQTIEGKFLDTYVSSTPVAKSPSLGANNKLSAAKSGSTNFVIKFTQ